jgi:hypothetical protein
MMSASSKTEAAIKAIVKTEKPDVIELSDSSDADETASNDKKAAIKAVAAPAVAKAAAVAAVESEADSDEDKPTPAKKAPVAAVAEEAEEPPAMQTKKKVKAKAKVPTAAAAAADGEEEGNDGASDVGDPNNDPASEDAGETCDEGDAATTLDKPRAGKANSKANAKIKIIARYDETKVYFAAGDHEKVLKKIFLSVSKGQGVWVSYKSMKPNAAVMPTDLIDAKSKSLTTITRDASTLTEIDMLKALSTVKVPVPGQKVPCYWVRDIVIYVKDLCNPKAPVVFKSAIIGLRALYQLIADKDIEDRKTIVMFVEVVRLLDSGRINLSALLRLHNLLELASAKNKNGELIGANRTVINSKEWFPNTKHAHMLLMDLDSIAADCNGAAAARYARLTEVGEVEAAHAESAEDKKNKIKEAAKRDIAARAAEKPTEVTNRPIMRPKVRAAPATAAAAASAAAAPAPKKPAAVATKPEADVKGMPPKAPRPAPKNAADVDKKHAATPMGTDKEPAVATAAADVDPPLPTAAPKRKYEGEADHSVATKKSQSVSRCWHRCGGLQRLCPRGGVGFLVFRGNSNGACRRTV